MAYKREDINGTSPLDIKKINDNMMNLWTKVFGDISFSDADNDLKKKILTQYLSVQDKGNFDKDYPLEVRFFIPPNVKKIVSSNFNFQVSNYRFDSGINQAGGGVQNLSISMSINSEVGTIPISTPTGTMSSGGTLPPLKLIMSTGYGIPASGSNFNLYLLPRTDVTGYEEYNHIHILEKQDIHDQTKHYHVVDDIEITQQPHYHNIDHTHSFNLPNHSHGATGTISLDNHSHPQTAGIVLSTSQPSSVKIIVNDVEIRNMGDGNNAITNIDISNNLKIGQWNIIKITTSNFGNGQVYGTVEFLVNS